MQKYTKNNLYRKTEKKMPTATGGKARKKRSTAKKPATKRKTGTKKRKTTKTKRKTGVKRRTAK